VLFKMFIKHGQNEAQASEVVCTSLGASYLQVQDPIHLAGRIARDLLSINGHRVAVTISYCHSVAARDIQVRRRVWVSLGVILSRYSVVNSRDN